MKEYIHGGIMIILLVCLALLQKGTTSEQPFLFRQEKKPNFHTPVFTKGYYLPLHITKDTTLGPQDTPIILAVESIVERGVTLTLLPGAQIVVHEYGSLRVQGTLTAIGTPQHPIGFTSNEQREENRAWNGILFEQGSNGTIMNATIHHASPGISCARPSNVVIGHTTFLYGNLEVFGACSYTP